MKPKYKIKDWLKINPKPIDLTKVYPIDLTAKKGWKGESNGQEVPTIKPEWKMTEIHKKIKHLNHTMIVWAENNKYKGHRNDDFIIPPRKFYNELQGGDVFIEWKDDLKFVSKLDFMLSDGKTLTKKELEYCNMLYEFYKKDYEKRN
mgnify:CR=1 FL=1